MTQKDKAFQIYQILLNKTLAFNPYDFDGLDDIQCEQAVSCAKNAQALVEIFDETVNSPENNTNNRQNIV